MFIAKDYELHMETPGCHPDSANWNATAVFSDDISDVFPYLNALWPDALYSPTAKQVVIRVNDRGVALKSHEITVSQVPDRDTATIELEKIIGEINRIWMDRENLTPLDKSRKRLVAMEIFQFLPQTNCKLCGHPTCFAFASKVTVGEADVQACTPLFDDEAYADKRQALIDMLAEASA